MSVLFNEDIAIFGDYARIIKKFSKSADSDSDAWKVSNGRNSATTRKIFSSYIDCVYAGAAIGLEENKKIPQTEFDANERKTRANILSSAWSSHSKELIYLYRLMLLTDPDLTLSKDERVRKAFMDVPESRTTTEFNYFLSYVYGGLKEMEQMFDKVHDYKAFADLISSIAIKLIGDEE